MKDQNSKTTNDYENYKLFKLNSKNLETKDISEKKLECLILPEEGSFLL